MKNFFEKNVTVVLAVLVVVLGVALFWTYINLIGERRLYEGEKVDRNFWHDKAVDEVSQKKRLEEEIERMKSEAENGNEDGGVLFDGDREEAFALLKIKFLEEDETWDDIIKEYNLLSWDEESSERDSLLSNINTLFEAEVLLREKRDEILEEFRGNNTVSPDTIVSGAVSSNLILRVLRRHITIRIMELGAY